jgi:hypothetical protein
MTRGSPGLRSLVVIALAVGACSSGSDFATTTEPADSLDVPDSLIEGPVDSTPVVESTAPAITDAGGQGAETSTPTSEVSGVRGVSCVPADAGTQSLVPGPEWSEGDQRELEVEIRRNSSPSAASSTPVMLTVLESPNGTDRRFEWVSSQTALQGLSGHARSSATARTNAQGTNRVHHGGRSRL